MNTKYEATKKYRRTPKGVLTNIYDHQKRRHPTFYSLGELHERFLNDKKFRRLYAEWVKSGYAKELRPSVDRINRKRAYSLDNIQILTWSENRYKQNMERRCRKGAVLMVAAGKIIKRFRSQREAVMKTGIGQSNISSVLNGKRQTAGGYRWEWEDNIHQNPELLEAK